MTLVDQKFDLLIVDKNLPGMSGIDFLRRARAQGVEAPVLLITALPTMRLPRELLELRVEGFLTKPFADINEVFTTAQEIVTRMERRQELKDRREAARRGDAANGNDGEDPS